LGWPLVESERPGLGPSWIARRIARAGWLKTERSADLILCTSTRLAEVYQSRKDVRARIAVIPVIVEAPAGSAPNLLHEKPSAIRLVWTGRFHREKQPLKAVDVLRELTNLGFDAHLTMIGDGILLSEVREVLSRYFSKTKWHLPGAVPNADVWNHLRNSHFFISTAEHEPYGRAIVEAMTMGCVPVCHRSGGPAEFLRHRQTALLIDRSDPLIFAKAIADTTQSFAIWKDLQLAALEKTKQFSSGVVGATMFSLFTALTAGKNRKESDLLPTSN
jgi:glycosyltransferase involved in cell wall biosynthesis